MKTVSRADQAQKLGHKFSADPHNWPSVRNKKQDGKTGKIRRKNQNSGLGGSWNSFNIESAGNSGDLTGQNSIFSFL